jgi:hypothetical protein
MRWRLCLFSVLLTCLVSWSTTPVAAGVTTCRGLAWPADAPCLTLTPAAGPVGTHVRISGRLSRGQIATWRTIFRENAHDPLSGLTGAFGACEIIGGIDRLRLVAVRDGAVRGSFVVTGGSAPCKQEGGKASHRFVPGAYTLDVSCMTCGVAVFTITAASLASTGPPISIQSALAFAVVAAALGGALTLSGRRRQAKMVRSTG